MTSGTDKELYAAIKRQMSPCSVVLILAGFTEVTANGSQRDPNCAN